MPTVSVQRELLHEALGKVYTQEAFEELCFEFGIELDDVTTEDIMFRKEKGQAAEATGAQEVIYKIDICANRYDLLCLEGLARALNIYRGIEKTPVFRAIAPPEPLVMTVKPETAQIRPVVVCAVLRGVKFTKASYNSFIDLQDKLHENICRKRTMVAIGTHDLDTLTPPFTYEARAPENISFCPLNQSKVMTAKELMTFYEADNKIKRYLHIIRDSPVYPVIYDSKGTVLSLPPIINSSHSAISLDTKNVFIEMTATDLTKAKIVLNTVVTMFSQYCDDKFSVEQVKVVGADGKTSMYPDLSNRTVEVDVAYTNRSIGIDIEGARMATLLNRMQLATELAEDGKTLMVSVPPTRSDILHPCDVVEDVAIAFGYNNIQKTVPPTVTIGKQLPINKLSDLLRVMMSQGGYTEVLNMALVSHDENFKAMRRADDGKTAVVLANPKTIEFQIARTSILPGIFKSIAANKSHALPIKLFECSDVLLLEPASDVGAVNRRRLGAVYAGQESGFEAIHGTVDRILSQLDVKRDPKREGKGYYIAESQDPTFFPGRRANVFVDGKIVGGFGIVHPEVLAHFSIPFACSALELDIHAFLLPEKDTGAALSVDTSRVTSASRTTVGKPVGNASSAAASAQQQPGTVVHTVVGAPAYVYPTTAYPVAGPVVHAAPSSPSAYTMYPRYY